MALYQYECATCGTFDAWRPMTEAADPCACPGCEGAASRALAKPHTRNSRAATRYFAESRNEKSAHEPMTERRLRAGTGTHRPGHGHGKHAHKVARASHDRPWMIGH
jgi:putative FmdB family regulatory protein